jgi:hypothetical protein
MERYTNPWQLDLELFWQQTDAYPGKYARKNQHICYLTIKKELLFNE